MDRRRAQRHSRVGSSHASFTSPSLRFTLANSCLPSFVMPQATPGPVSVATSSSSASGGRSTSHQPTRRSMSPFMHTSVAARYADAWVAALIPMLFTTGAGMNGTIDTIFPAGRTAEQQAAIMRGFKCVHLYGPLMVVGAHSRQKRCTHTACQRTCHRSLQPEPRIAI